MREKEYFIRRTFSLARKAEGFTSPNPLVGAVLVKNGRVIAEGYHKKAGAPHAEIEVLDKVKDNARGATLYVNLEPCCHWGKTPPCVDRIIKEGIKKVVIAVEDPNPLVKGKSIRKLCNYGIDVEVGVLAEEAKRLNEVFFTNKEKGRPFIVVKIAQSLDGKIATAGGVSRWITSDRSRKYARRLRDKYDCIGVGINTVLKDNPTLEGERKSPYKLVIDPSLKIPLDSKLVRKYADRLIIVSSRKSFNRKKAKMMPKAIRFVLLNEKKNMLRMDDIFSRLFISGINSIFFEGGSFTLGKIFDCGIVDKIYMFVSPKIIGGSEALSSIGGEGAFDLSQCWVVKDFTLKRIGDNILFTGYPVKENKLGNDDEQ